MKKFIKENLVLLIGLTLPVLLVVLFFLATVLPKSLSAPPQYEMLFAIDHYDYAACGECEDWKRNLKVDFVVRDGVLKVRVTRNDSKNLNYHTRRLMVYDGKTESVREIALDMAKFADSADGAELVLDETRNMLIDVSSKSPDGFELEGAPYGGGGLVGALFGGGYRSHGHRIRKDSVGYKLPSIQNDYYYNNLRFIGWVVSRK